MSLRKIFSSYPQQKTKRYSLAGLLLISLLALTTQLLWPHPALADGPVVNTIADENDGSCSDSDCSLRDAIALAASGDTILFAPALAGQTITVSSQLQINQNLTLDGSALADPVKISGGGATRVFVVNANVTLAHLDIRDGQTADFGSGLWVTSGRVVTLTHCVLANNVTAGNGGGLFSNTGSIVTIDQSVIRDNVASSGGSVGGGLFNWGTMTVLSSTLSGNRAIAGGGIRNQGNLTINASTISGNTAAYGGGIANLGNLTLANCTFSGNAATHGTYSGSALYQWGNSSYWTAIQHCTIANNTTAGSHQAALELENGLITFTNSIIADNGGRNFYLWNETSTIFTSLGYNLVDAWSGAATPTTGDLTGDPLLDALANNGPSTGSGQAILTHALLPGSPALDAGNPAVSLTTDQRGVLRPQGAAPDIGAFEQGPLRLAKTATPAVNAPYHGLVTYTLVLSNNGALDAAGLRLTDTLPASVDFAGWLVNPGAGVAADEITWNGPLTAATALTFTFQVTHTGDYGEVVTNTARFSGADERGSAAAGFITAAPFIAVSKTVTPAANVPNHGVVTYTISVKNEGLADDPAAMLTDTLPVEVDFARWLVNPGATVLNDEITWNAPLAAGAALTFTFQATHTGNSGDVVHNTASGIGTAGGSSGSADFSVACGPLITVQNTAEDGPGSLRYALAGVCPGGVVNFAPALADKTITLTRVINLNKSLTLDGSGLGASVRIDGGGATRLFFIQDTAAVTMTQLILTRGYASGYGGAIYNAGTLTLQGMTFTDNQATQLGGAVYSYYGTRLKVSNSEFYRNQASIGGALYVYENNTVAEVTGSVFMTNTASSSGGAIHNQEATLTITNSLVAGNRSNNNGGGLNLDSGVVTLAGCTIANNQADFGAGLSHYYGQLLITNTQILSNTAAEYGGVLYGEMGYLTVSHSVIAGNTANNFAGGLALRNGVTTISYSTLRDNRCPAGSGGALYSSQGNDLTLDYSTVTGNQAGGKDGKGGGIFNVGSPLTVRYSRFTGNSGSYGGGLYSQSGTLRVTHSTFYSNTANVNGGGLNLAAGTVGITASLLASNTASGSGAGLYAEDGVLQIANSTLAGNGSAATLSGGGLTNNLGDLTLRHVTIAANTAITGGGLINMGGGLWAYNTLMAHNSGGDCGNFTLPGTIQANVNNLAADGSCGTMLSGDPLLGPLADNGGETSTYGLLSGSPAIDAGDDAACLSPDQRGVTRPQGARCDIGAFELLLPEMAVVGNSQVITVGNTSPSTADHTHFGSVAVGGTLTRTFTISNSGGMALSLTGSPVVSLTGAGAGSFSVVVQPTTAISPNATAAFQVRFTPSVTGTRVATVTIANSDSNENPYDFAIEGIGDNSIRWVYLPLILR